MTEPEDRQDEFTAQAVRDERPGCLLGSVLGVIARLVLIVPPVIMGAQAGIWAVAELSTAGSGAHALAATGACAGAALGLALILRGARREGGRSVRADVALCMLSLVFLARVAMAYIAPIEFADIAAAYLAALAGALIVWLIG